MEAWESVEVEVEGCCLAHAMMVVILFISIIIIITNYYELFMNYYNAFAAAC